MNNLIIDEITKKKLSTWTRLLILFLDSIMIFGIFLLLFYTVGTYAITTTASDAIDGINDIYITECNKDNLDYEVGIYGIYQLDKDKYIELVLSDPTISYDQAMESYNNKYYEIDTNIQSYDGYSEYYEEFNASYYIVLLVSMFIPCLIFMVIIPLTNKNNKTLSMFITKTSLVDDKTNIVSNNKVVFIRFFTIYAIEFALGYAIIQLVGLGLLFIINMITISLSNKKKAIHDYFSKCHVDKDEYAFAE